MTVEQEAAQSFIPVNEPLVGEREAAYVLDCMRTGWISSEGPYVAKFEQAWAAYCGVEHGVAMSSGTAALFAAVDALRLQPGDEVIMPAFTIISCAHAIIAAGGVPVLVDADERTWCMDVRQVAGRITPRTRAIMAVHIYGHPVDMAPLRALAREHGLKIIEDAAEAHGAEYRGARAGGLGDIGCFSFYANKILTTGEGGMLVTNDAAIAARARSYRNLAFRPERRFHAHGIGGELPHDGGAGCDRPGAGRGDRRARRAQARRSGGATRGCWPASTASRCRSRSRGPRNVYWMYGIVLDERQGIDAAAFAATAAATRRRYAAVLPGHARAAGAAGAGAVRRRALSGRRSGSRGRGCTCRPG